MLLLSNAQPFARGGNRLCFVHPESPGVCIKVRRPDFTLEDCRRKKGFPRNLRPLSSFDDNREEFQVINHLVADRGQIVLRHIYRCDGFIDTDLGKGLATELVRDEDGRISMSLKQYIYEYGYNSACQEAVDELLSFWREHLIPSRDLLTHNVLVHQANDGRIIRLVVIDGLGSPHFIPFDLLPKFFRHRYVERKIERFLGRIAEFVENCRQGRQPSELGILRDRNLNL